MPDQAIASRHEWLTHRRALLARETEATRLRDGIDAGCLALPWVALEKAYTDEYAKAPPGKARCAGSGGT
jgi:predicted dithiol-disulfide oxidoreductase (DUF899 family)